MWSPSQAKTIDRLEAKVANAGGTRSDARGGWLGGGVVIGDETPAALLKRMGLFA